MPRKTAPPMESSPHGEWTTYITVKVSHFIFAVRLIQIIFGFFVGAFAVALMTWTGWTNYDYEYGPPPLWALIPILAITCMITLMGIVGVFAYKRPNDVHWHLMLTLDWLTFTGSLANTILGILSDFFWFGQELGLYIAMNVCIVTILLAILIPIIRTHRLAKRRALPPPNTRKETWYHMEDERGGVRTPESSVYNPVYMAPPPPPPPQESSNHVRRAPSKAVSKADTMARWSGLSGDTTTAYPTMVGDVEAPAYKVDGTLSPAMSVSKH